MDWEIEREVDNELPGKRRLLGGEAIAGGDGGVEKERVALKVWCAGLRASKRSAAESSALAERGEQLSISAVTLCWLQLRGHRAPTLVLPIPSQLPAIPPMAPTRLKNLIP